ncbi:hypothetical protein [Polyangium sorediatum]|uniref:Secreted protein n=1 Tax=Polyangium sorediatum TaxID=889274 RepID=A0ABT6NZB1_9BACT|nr:hypothetical protein [Polyangium sorediatum]MDI1433687.1 hypothetical protein [Polyangium sorediatum]
MNRRVLGTLGFSLWTLAALACAGASPGDEVPSAASADTTCQSDADCVVVETACCDHCNGGKVEAFNKAHADAHRPQGCAGVACTRRGCGDAVAECVDHTCQAKILPLGS